MTYSDNHNMVEIFAGDQQTAFQAHNLLENAGIESFIENSLLGSIAPWQVSAGGVAPVKVMTSDAYIEKSLEILRASGLIEGE